MAAVTDTTLGTLGLISPTAILLATSGDTLTYTSGSNQILALFNTDVSSINVTIDGDGGTTLVVPGAGATTASVASGVVYAVPAGAFRLVRLDTISAYCQGTVAISAATGAKVAAVILH